MHSERINGRQANDGLSPQQRSLRARLAAHAMHAKHDTDQVSRPGREAFLARFERQVDPDGVMPDAERRRRAEHAKRAHMTRLALRSAQARRTRGRRGGAAEVA